MGDTDSDSGVDLPKINNDELKKYIKPKAPIKIKPVKVKVEKPVKKIINKIVIPKINLTYQKKAEKEADKLQEQLRQQQIHRERTQNNYNINNNYNESESDNEDTENSNEEEEEEIITNINLKKLEERIKNIVIESRPTQPVPTTPQNKYKHTWTDAKGFTWHF
jgi:Fe2+ transport system protein B